MNQCMMSYMLLGLTQICKNSQIFANFLQIFFKDSESVHDELLDTGFNSNSRKFANICKFFAIVFIDSESVHNELLDTGFNSNSRKFANICKFFANIF